MERGLNVFNRCRERVTIDVVTGRVQNHHDLSLASRCKCQNPAHLDLLMDIERLKRVVKMQKSRQNVTSFKIDEKKVCTGVQLFQMLMYKCSCN
jgi:hypothetical protein